MPLSTLLFLVARHPADAPRLLIAPLVPAKKDGPTPSSSLGNHLAQEFDEDGRTIAIIWGITDPVFRPAALEGKLGSVPDLPTRPQALDAARKLNAPYVLLYRSERKGGKLEASAELVQEGRTVWKDSKTMGAKLGDLQNDDDTAASIARTWVLLLSGGPLKTLPTRKTVATPNPTQGQAPTVPDVPVPLPPTPKADDGAALERQVESLMKDGKPEAALALARDAVDANPLSPVLRIVLVRLLDRQGDPAGAASEALRAADLMPDREDLQIDAVRRLIGVGEIKTARAEVEGLRTRRPEDKTVRRLAAELALAEDDAPTAVREMESLLKTGDDPQARLLRGLGRARLGGGEGAAADLKAWAESVTDPSARAEGYLYARRTLAAMAQKAARAMPSLLQRAAAQPKSGAVRDELDEVQRQAQARTAAWTAIPCPEGEQKGYDAWSLAHRLMALVAADLRAYLTTGSEDALTSARIDLGEAQRAMKDADK